ncbi:hypothetical protein AB0N88_03705 [Streptomyces sp. NPDC093516]|uniref:hypothetical protein n=1 Tax=Streptomyces sp. NPDC093516 TaxID=3155304 RepID=UPI00342E11CC
MEHYALVSLRPTDEPCDANLTDAFGEASGRRCVESGHGLVPNDPFDFASLFAASETRPLTVPNLCPDALRGGLEGPAQLTVPGDAIVGRDLVNAAL